MLEEFFEKGFENFFEEFKKIRVKYLIYFMLLIIFASIFGIAVKILNLRNGFYIIWLLILIIGSFILTYKFKKEIKDKLFYDFQAENFKISSGKDFFPFDGQKILIDSWLWDVLLFIDWEGDSFEYKTDDKIFQWEQLFWRNAIYGDKSIIRILYRYFIIVWKKLNGDWNIQWKFLVYKKWFFWYLLNFLTYSIFWFIISVFLLSIIWAITGFIDIDMILIISIVAWIIFWLYFLISQRGKIAADNVPVEIKDLLEKGWMLNFRGDTVYLVKNLCFPYLNFTMFDTKRSIISKIKKYFREIDFVVDRLKSL